MSEKKTNLALACDVTSSKELLQFADKIGPYICVLKTHIDILEDFTADLPLALQRSAEKHNFLIFEDRKFADIGQTVSLQYGKGMYKISEWADFINAHIVPGPGIIDGLRQAGGKAGLLLLAEMSSAGSLATGEYTAKAVQMAKENADFVSGFIAQRRLVEGMLHFTPGVKLERGSDLLGQMYRTIEEVVAEGSDVVIAGRDILQAKDPVERAAIYRERAWNALA